MRSQKARVQAMLASSSSGASQTESIDIMYGIERSPKAVSAAATRGRCATEVPDRRERVGRRRSRIALEDQVDRVIPEAAQIVALPVGTVLAERDERVEQLLDVAVAHLAGEVGDQIAELAQRLEQPLALVGVAGVHRGDRVDPLAPVLLGVVRIARDGRELDDRADVVALVGEEVAPEADRAGTGAERDRAARRTSASGRRDAARTRTP